MFKMFPHITSPDRTTSTPLRNMISLPSGNGSPMVFYIYCQNTEISIVSACINMFVNIINGVCIDMFVHLITVFVLICFCLL